MQLNPCRPPGFMVSFGQPRQDSFDGEDTRRFVAEKERTLAALVSPKLQPVVSTNCVVNEVMGAIASSCKQRVDDYVRGEEDVRVG